MNISEEKRYIYSMMNTITDERRELTKIYYDLKTRLSELDKLQREGLDELSIEGRVDLHNSRKLALMSSNIRREAEHTIKKIEREIAPEPEVAVTIPKAEIEIEKEKVSRRHVTTVLTSERAAGIIAHILKESEIPMAVKDLFDAFNEKLDVPVTRNNFRNNILPRAAKRNRNIDNISRGFYQYLKRN